MTEKSCNTNHFLKYDLLKETLILNGVQNQVVSKLLIFQKEFGVKRKQLVLVDLISVLIVMDHGIQKLAVKKSKKK